MIKKLFRKKDKESSEELNVFPSEIDVSEKKNENNEEQEIAAAISLALNMYLQEMHDYEQMVLTIQRVMRPYSPWSSKIYGLRQYPRR